MRSLLPSVAGFLLLVSPLVIAEPRSQGEKPKLVVQITVDQLRGDLPLRLYDRFGEKGFRYLMDEGAQFHAAHYSHAITETAPGHATLYTGSNPREHGIIGNEWFDSGTGMKVYNCEDERHAILGEEPRAGSGTSPVNLLSSTITDEVILASGRAARVFGVSVKDRGAILPAGHYGKAFWYSGSKGEFVTSDYYYDEYPAWASEWNASGVVGSYQEKSWKLFAPLGSYIAAESDDRACERSYMHLGRTFPHPLAAPDGSGLSKAVRYTPVGDELVFSFARKLVEAEKLGRGSSTDFLTLSFSSTDYVGHAFGPLSLEAEDNLLHLDNLLAQLFTFLDEQVGLDKVLVVLSADHGAPDCPDMLADLGYDVGWVDSVAMLKSANAAVKAYFETDETLLRAHVTPYLWLDHDLIAEMNLDADEVASVVAAGALETGGLDLAIPRWQLEGMELPDSPLNRRIRAAFHGDRSGDVYLVPQQQWLIGTGNAKSVLASLHGSPWSYDTHVPIFFAGPGVTPGDFYRQVAPRDIAPTIAAMLGVKPPTACSGTVLVEVLGE
ncbi:MAG: putative AlkP superfamily pyrophosphatase or phosphodiesterase [Planctomycetota bacterium]|jgi:predicted AlkP superfamily pyrophosphatase or phosphodiesterase